MIFKFKNEPVRYVSKTEVQNLFDFLNPMKQPMFAPRKRGSFDHWIKTLKRGDTAGYYLGVKMIIK